MSDYYEYGPQVQLSGPIVVSGYLADFTRSVTYRASAHLGLTYYDIDRLVEHEAAMEIGRILLEEGEAAYREVESQCLARALGQKPVGLIALGDGGLLRSENLTRIEDEGQLIVLDLDLANLFWRVQKLARRLEPARWHPLFAGVPDDVAEIRPYYQERKVAFEQATTRIDANSLNTTEACQALMDHIAATSS
ncbi:MAG: shikimate kinase [Thermoanaerobaculia bacterium]